MTGPPRPPQGWAARPVTAARAGLLALLPLTVLAGLVGGLADGRDGAVGALLGMAVPGTVLAITWLSAEVGARRSPQAFALLMLAAFGMKLVAVVVLLLVLDRFDVGNRTALGLSALVGLVVSLVVEAVVVARTRAPYVDL